MIKRKEKERIANSPKGSKTAGSYYIERGLVEDNS